LEELHIDGCQNGSVNKNGRIWTGLIQLGAERLLQTGVMKFQVP
jgi:hypothetical protein